ncbi:MAG TPA: RNA polymerase sigma factor [Polyangiaceae bacterium]|nr:RNA polymerase sigma factor [Polyangiaceae bacterium]HNZ22455.1 RNA polymerase sigma factor [Polyangiaceae bacterium]HOD23537.1 RNA polymerase sigma factor [Polyangiaceae bacterium]HOE51352.1 RNA polymerase sigma factor [Polyangiaceae bacterium]HOH00240.1 RNA polymerase sigma factor [Polyangiaceae bacterium]
MSEKDSASPQIVSPDIIARAQRGEREAVTQLFGDHLGTVHRFALRMCRDEDRARDIAQESLLTALKSLDSFRGDASFSTWLFTITRSHCGRLRRRSERESVSEDGDVVTDNAASEEPLPDALAAHGEVTSVVEQALDALDPEEREVVLLRDVEGLSTKEAADALQISVAALKSRLHRARSSLREAVRRVVEPTEFIDQFTDPGCPPIIEAFSKKLEGDLSVADCDSFQQHIASCPACAQRCASIQAVLGACATLRTHPPSTNLQTIIDRTALAIRKQASTE